MFVNSISSILYSRSMQKTLTIYFTGVQCLSVANVYLTPGIYKQFNNISWLLLLLLQYCSTSDSDSDSSLSRRNSTASGDLTDGPLVITEIMDNDQNSSVDLDKALGDVPPEPPTPSPSMSLLDVPQTNGVQERNSSGHKVRQAVCLFRNFNKWHGKYMCLCVCKGRKWNCIRLFLLLGCRFLHRWKWVITTPRHLE